MLQIDTIWSRNNNMMKYVGLSVGIKLETNKGQLSESDNNNNDS